jgi:hypothetical protein
MKQYWILLVILFLLYVRSSTYASFPVLLDCNCSRTEGDIIKLRQYWQQVLIDEDVYITLHDPFNTTRLREYFNRFKTMKLSHDNDIDTKVLYNTVDVSNAYKYYSLAKSNYSEHGGVDVPVTVPLLPLKPPLPPSKCISKNKVRSMKLTKRVHRKGVPGSVKKLSEYGWELYRDGTLLTKYPQLYKIGEAQLLAQNSGI